MLRKSLLWIGALLVVGGAAASLLTACAAGLWPAGMGVLLLLALLVERRGYQQIQDHVPGPDWQKTDEQFLDPSSGAPVTVWYQPATGNRVYVRGGRP